MRLRRARRLVTLRYGKNGFVLVLPPDATQRHALWLIHLGALHAGGASPENLKELNRERGGDGFPPSWVPNLIRLPLVPTDLPVPLEPPANPEPVTAYIKRQDKLLHARMMLARATTRAKRAETLRKKWAQKVKRLERAAAKPEG